MKTIKVTVISVAAIGLLWLLFRNNPGVSFISDFFTPIIFYGKVVDENGSPVPLAKVSISFADHIGKGDSKSTLETDSQGLFSTWGHGLGVIISVSKTGYYTRDKSSGSFSYNADGGPDDRHSSSANAAIFVLRKMGVTEPLLTFRSSAQIAKDGTPIRMTLAGGQTYNVTPGDIKVESWTHDEGIPPNGNHPFDWRCRITVPGGGIQLRTGGDFDFIAPEDGYKPSDEISMSATDPKWRHNQSREYFLKLGNGDYARIHFGIGAGGANIFEITSYLNPQPGHRNLEYDPNQAPLK